jgi:hypothetical protein
MLDNSVCGKYMFTLFKESYCTLYLTDISAVTPSSEQKWTKCKGFIYKMKIKNKINKNLQWFHRVALLSLNPIGI